MVILHCNLVTSVSLTRDSGGWRGEKRGRREERERERETSQGPVEPVKTSQDHSRTSQDESGPVKDQSGPVRTSQNQSKTSQAPVNNSQNQSRPVKNSQEPVKTSQNQSGGLRKECNKCCLSSLRSALYFWVSLLLIISFWRGRSLLQSSNFSFRNSRWWRSRERERGRREKEVGERRRISSMVVGFNKHV